MDEHRNKRDLYQPQEYGEPIDRVRKYPNLTSVKIVLRLHPLILSRTAAIRRMNQ
jgi:hypothetical protein